jgi:hypothetical protein
MVLFWNFYRDKTDAELIIGWNTCSCCLMHKNDVHECKGNLISVLKIYRLSGHIIPFYYNWIYAILTIKQNLFFFAYSSMVLFMKLQTIASRGKNDTFHPHVMVTSILEELKWLQPVGWTFHLWRHIKNKSNHVAGSTRYTAGC